MIARKPQTAARVALRPLSQADLPRVHRWRTDPVAARYCGWDRPEFSTLGRIEGLYLPAIMDPEGSGAWHFAIESEGEPVGLVTYDRLDPHNASCRLFLLLGEIQGRGIGTDALHRILSLLFGPVEMRRVFVEVHAENERALRCLRRAGFREEGRLRKAERFEGRWADVAVLSLLASEWRRRKEDAEWTIGPLRPDETDWFLRLAEEAGCETWETDFALENDEKLVWRCNDVPAALTALDWKPGEVEIHILAVDDAFRRQGLATRILHDVRHRALAAGIHRVTLLTTNDNAPAIALYQRIGFRMTALFAGRPEARRGYLRLGLNGIPLRDEIEMTWDV